MSAGGMAMEASVLLVAGGVQHCSSLPAYHVSTKIVLYFCSVFAFSFIF